MGWKGANLKDLSNRETDSELKEGFQAVNDHFTSVLSGKRNLRPRVSYDDEAEEANDANDEADDDDEADEAPKRLRTKKAISFDYSKFTEAVAENFDGEEMGLIDILIEYSIKKFKELKERSADLSKIQIRNPFIEKEEKPNCLFVSQVMNQDYNFDA